uniref:Uncharacterized protein n=1 Tax=Oryza brachyantha TaxID=4533 RepID=J3LVX0_ORYBR
MASMKYDLPLLDYKTILSLWQVNMRAGLVQSLNLDEALESFSKRKDEWTAEEAVGSDWFSSYNYVQNGDVVYMGDDKPCEIVGIGSVQIKTHDNLTRTLKDRNLLVGCTQGNMKFYEHYIFDAFDDYCRDEGIVKHHTILYIPQQNGVAERMNKTIILKAHCILSNAHMNRHFWEGVLFSMSTSFVFNKSVMFNDSLSTNVTLDGSDEVHQHINMQVENVVDQETEIVDNDVHDIVQHSPPILQPQDQFIAHSRPKRSCGPPICLFEECNMVDYALSYAEPVENTYESELKEEKYMDEPEGFIVPGKKDYACKLKRSLYGLKQSPRQWYKSCAVSWKATLQPVIA